MAIETNTAAKALIVPRTTETNTHEQRETLTVKKDLLLYSSFSAQLDKAAAITQLQGATTGLTIACSHQRQTTTTTAPKRQAKPVQAYVRLA